MTTLLLALLLAFILVVTTLQADAVKEENEQRVKAKSNLLSETSLGRKANAGGTEAKDLPKKNSANTNTANTNDANGGDDDDVDTNDSYQNYGNNSGSSTGSHHYFVDVRRPPP